MKKNKEEKKGEYLIRKNNKGYMIHGPKLRKKGEWCPNAKVILERYKSRGADNLASKWIRLMGIIHSGEYNLPKGREALNLKNPSQYVTKEEIIQTIKEYWPEEDVNKFLDGKCIEINSPGNFALKYERVYRSLMRNKKWKKIGGLRGFIDEVVYPGLKFYEKLTGREFVVDDCSVDGPRLEKKIICRSNKGLLLGKSLSRSPDPHERKIGRQINKLTKIVNQSIAKQGWTKKPEPHEIKRIARSIRDYKIEIADSLPDKKIKITRADLINSFTGLEKNDIEIGNMKKRISNLSEDINEFLFRWARLADYELPSFISSRKIYRDKEIMSFQSGENGNSCADLRIGNQPIEVKNLREKFRMGALNKIFKIYSHGSKWNSGEDLENLTMVFFMNPDFYEESLPDFEKRGINYITYPELKKSLKELTGILKSDWANELGGVFPKFNNLSYIVDYAEEIALNPALLIRSGNKERKEFCRKSVRALIKRAKGIEENES
ncbi:MAG: hypothetical protein PVJ67_04465 [Candidatus Pacearchaeota archaeon]|jgi:hypothetical protein